MNRVQAWFANNFIVPAVKAGIPLNAMRWGSYWGGSEMDNGLPNSTQYADGAGGWLQAAHGNVWARNCIRARASAIAQTPMKLYEYSGPEGETRTEITDHPALMLLETVNPINANAKSFRRSVETQLAIFGTCYVLKVRGALNKPNELYVLSAQMVEPLPSDTAWIAGYRWNGTTIYSVDDVIRFWYPGLDGSIYAESPTSTALRYINSYNIADISAEAIDRRGGQGGGIVSYDVLALNNDQTRMADQWDRKRADPKNAGKDLHMPPGTKYESGALTAQQMQREERMMRLAHNIMASYLTPPAIAGDMSDASVLANAAMQSKTFWELFALDELGFIEETFNNDLLWREWPETQGRMFFEHDLSEVSALNEDSDSKVNRAVIVFQGGIASLNDAREIAELEPVENPLADAVTIVAAQGSELIDSTTGEVVQSEAAQSLRDAEAQAAQQKQDQLAAMREQAQAQQGQGSSQVPQSLQPQAQQPPQANPVPEPPAARAIPILDFVGMKAFAPDGSSGVIESIKRFGDVNGLIATKADPVCVIDGRAYWARDVKAVIDG